MSLSQNDKEVSSSPSGSMRRAVAGSLVLGLVTLSAGLAWAGVLSGDASDLAGRTLGTRALAVEDAAQAEIGRYADALELVAAGLAAATEVDEVAFQTAAAPLDSMNLAGATSLAFMAGPVADAELDRFEALWVARGSTGLELDPVEALSTHVFAVLFKPLDGSDQRRTGIDVAGAPAPYEALMESQTSGEVSFSRAYQLLIDQELPESERQTSFVVTAPVMKQGQFLGWVLMGLRGQDFLGGVLEKAAEGRVDVALLAEDTAGINLTVASVAAGADGSGGAGGESEQQRRTLSLPAAQQMWTLEVAADTPALIGNIRHRALAVQVTSVVIALLVAGLCWAVTSSRARSRVEVHNATRDLATAEEAARHHATMLNTMVETIDKVGVTVVDANGRFLVQSRAARRILGVETEPNHDSSGEAGIGDIDGPELWQEHYGMFFVDGLPFVESEMPLVRALAGESTDDVEMVIRNRVRPHGIRISISGRPIILGPGRTGALAVFRDVTEERRQQAEQAAFSGMVAHDLKNPLALVRGCLELAGGDIAKLTGPPDLVSTVANYLGKAAAAAGRMAELIDDLLAYTLASNTTLDVDDVDLGELVRATAAAVIDGHFAEREALGDNPTQPSVHVGELPRAMCDEERMRQVFGNLIGNALKYVKPGQRPVVDITAEIASDGVGLRIFVADRGIGIPAPLQAEVVKPFVRTPTAIADPTTYPGTGLGLAICQRILERHGGSLRLQSNPGGGTIAVLNLPNQRLPAGPHPDESKGTNHSRTVVSAP